MPGRYEPLEEVCSEVDRCRIDTVACLAPLSEIREKAPAYATAIEARSLPWAIRSCPIPDFGVPEDFSAFANLANEVAASLREGNGVLVHCAGGVGRTGTFATCVLIELGFELDRALQFVLDAGSGPETSAQRAFIRDFESSSRSDRET
jgi:protein-tyrosine phosphatase